MNYNHMMKGKKTPIVQLFKAAYLELVPTGGREGKQKEVVYQSGVPQSTLSSIIAGRRAGTEEQRRAIAEALGYKYEDFLDLGRRALGLPSVDKLSTVPPSPEVAAYLDKARSVIEAGGKEAETLKGVISALVKE